MLVSDNVRKCVAFVAALKKTDYEIRGTAFFCMHCIEGTDRFKAYLVTARHVVENAAAASRDANVYLRVNQQTAVAAYLPCELSAWEFHVDDKVDVAILPLDWGDSHLLEQF